MYSGARSKLFSLSMVSVLALAAFGAVGACGSDDDNKDAGTGGRGGTGGTGTGGTTVDGGGGTGGTTTDGGAGGTGGGTAGSTGTDGGGTDAPAAALTQGQAAALVLEANTGEVHAGEVATNKATATAVMNFAMMMINDHTMATRRLQMRLQMANINAEDSADRRMLSMQAAQAIDMLWATPVATFDRVYMQSQVMMHMMVLQLMDTKIVPAVTDAQLKTELMSQRTAVMAHLTEAQSILAGLSGDGGASDAPPPPRDGGADAAAD